MKNSFNNFIIYDTTLRDGMQGQFANTSVDDRIYIAKRLDDFGIPIIEGGWPGTNETDTEFFRKVKDIEFKNARIAAFGSTHHPRKEVLNDPKIKALIDSEAEIITIFGKTWGLHVKDVLKISGKKNLQIICNSIKYLKAYTHVKEVYFDAEHFFDGYKANPLYALNCLKAAQEAGADCIILCDTNGGTMPYEIPEIIKAVQETITVPLGIHAHNDAECAVANTMIAVKMGINHVQGTINGNGERCGNANLCSIIPNLELKLGKKSIKEGKLNQLRDVSRFVSEIMNVKHRNDFSYVGESAFAHKAGVHVNAIIKNPKTYEHINPELVGNRNKFLVSELSGASNLIARAKQFGIDLNTDTASPILKRLKKMENLGYAFEGAEASLELMIKRELGLRKYKFFELVGFRVIIEKREGDKVPITEATIRIKVDGDIKYTAAMGDGPVNALDKSFRDAIINFYPSLKNVFLQDYKVRILDNGRKGTESSTRVMIQSSDGIDNWRTAGISENIIEASWQALVDSMEYKLLKERGVEI